MKTVVVLVGIVLLAPACGAVRGGASPSVAADPCPSGMSRIPAGEFAMGSNDGDPRERPVHHVDVASFCLDTHETTSGDYQSCVESRICPKAPTEPDFPDLQPDARRILSAACTGGDARRRAHPITCVEWSMADTFCRWAGKRLPTEEEWEYAARGRDGRRYPWGNEPPGPRRLNACGPECVAWATSQGLSEQWIKRVPMYSETDGWTLTAPVGSFPLGRSPFGVDDMAGNASEWVASGMSEDYAHPREERQRVDRSAGWGSYDATYVRVTSRDSDLGAVRVHDRGFRCAQ